ncbi:MAG: hypothetical protein JW885_11700 [Deltaproteobacteria bacterium]|nr:hypothetical protein [Candidatus Zymogenaceae bacterium]
MGRSYPSRKRRAGPPFSVTALLLYGLMVCACSLLVLAQEGKYDAVYESLHDTPTPPGDRLKTGAPEPVTDDAMSLHPDADTRNADDISTSISNRHEMPPLLSVPASSNSSVDAGVNRRGASYDSPSEFHRATDSNHNDDEVYYLNLNIRF